MTRHALPLATQFCSATLELFDGYSFFLDGNSKITRSNGTFAEPKPNAFSLPAASVPDPYPHAGLPACPGSTAICRESCYVRGLAKAVPELYFRYQSNAEALARCLANDADFAESAIALGYWIADHCAGGFRWHVSGDVMGILHAEWIALVCSFAPHVEHWIYTRTLEAVATLVAIPNLAVNVSADADNFDRARSIALTHGARLCYLTGDGSLPDLPGGSVIFPDYVLRGRALDVPTDAPWWQSLTHEQRAMTCGADFFGQSESTRCGPCQKCLT